MLVSESINQFKRGGSSKKTLDIGKFRNQIDFNNLPRTGLWKVISGDKEYLDEAIIAISGPLVYMVKNWEDNGGEWARDIDSDPLINPIESSLDNWLKENKVFNMIPFEIIEPTLPPNWENIRLME